jgi:hypothetical protein
MGVDSDPGRKAEKDFQKRTGASHGLDITQMSFVFVTPRKWLKKTEWSEKKKQRGIWKDVRAYDSANLTEWLEIAPAVDVWFARLVGRRPEGVTDIDEHWENLAALTYPALKPAVFLASREPAIEALTQWLAGPPSACAFEARSPMEVLDLVAAHVVNLDQEQHDALAARILVVAEREAWSALAATRNRLILIPWPSLAVEPEMVAEAVRQGHHVLLCSHGFATAHMATHKLPPPYRDDLERALISSGWPDEQARRFAREAGGSLTVLKRRLTHLASTRQPEWSQPLEATSLVPVLLAGSWDDSCAADRTVIEKLAGTGRTYAEVLSVAHRWLQGEDPPVMRVLTRWSLVSREDSWLLLAPYITRQQLDTFEEVAIAVLGEDDPQYELPPHERWYAALRHKLPQYSPQLRTGLAETLALLGVRSDRGLIRDAAGPVTRAERVVQSLLPAHASWQRWASLSDYLPLFAEACPDVFLNAIKRDLDGAKALLQLFKQGSGLLGGSNPLAGLLWALETLAWESSFLSPASLLLAQLVQDAPIKQLAARPQNSLREIFLPWLPQTIASVETRLHVLNLLMRRYPDAAWHLLLSLLPTRLDSTNYTHQPRWRDWAGNGTRDTTPAECQQQVEACADLLLSNIDQSVERREQLLASLEHLPLAAQQRFLEDLQAFASASLGTETRRRIADKIREKVHLHRHFSHTHWALPPNVVDTLEGLQRQFEPQDIVTRNVWLFNHDVCVYLAQESPGLLLEDPNFQAQRAALADILTTEGLPKVLALAETVEDSHAVGHVLGKAKLLSDDSAILPSLLTAEQAKIATFAQGYVWGRFASWEEVEQLPLATWSVEQVSAFARSLCCEQRTWELVAQLGTDSIAHYWQHVNVLFYPHEDDAEYKVTMLLQHHRPWDAIKVLGMALHKGYPLRSLLLVEALEAGLQGQATQGSSDAHDSMLGRHIRALIQCLQSAQDVDIQRLAALEWGYLHVLDGRDVLPQALHALLQQPQFFAELLCLIFWSQQESAEVVDPPTEQQKAAARNAYTLLSSWNTIPGIREDGTVDETKLMEWVTTARALCAQTGRLEVCDSRIGQVFAHSVQERDGSWPCIPVRDVIEEVANEEFIRGFEIGIFNQRGVYSKSPIEGGAQERELAQRYTAYANACDIEWPRTASVLRRVAQQYEREAQRADEEVQERL